MKKIIFLLSLCCVFFFTNCVDLGGVSGPIFSNDMGPIDIDVTTTMIYWVDQPTFDSMTLYGISELTVEFTLYENHVLPSSKYQTGLMLNNNPDSCHAASFSGCRIQIGSIIGISQPFKYRFIAPNNNVLWQGTDTMMGDDQCLFHELKWEL